MREERFIDSAIRKALARRTSGAASPCPDENLLAAYLERSLSGQERSRFESHVLDCASCREILALSMKTAEEDELPAVGIGSSRERKLLFHFSVPLAAVAALVFGIGMAALFLLTREVRKPERTEVAEQRLPAAAPAASAARQAGREPSSAPGETTTGGFAPTPPPALPAKREALDEEKLRAKDSEVRVAELRAPPRQVPSTESEGRAPHTDMAASNEVANKPAEFKRKNQAGTATTQAGGEADAGKIAGGAVGGVVGGVLPSARSVEERAQRGEVMPQAATAIADSGGAKTEALERVVKMAAKNRGAALSTSTAPAAESRVRDTLRLLASDVKAGRHTDAATRVIGGHTFERYEGFWVDLKCVDNPDAEVVDLNPDSPQLDDVRKAVPGLEDLRRTGFPILLAWNSKIYLLR